jgi:transposase-like protein
MTSIEQWTEVFDESDYTIAGAANAFGIPARTISSWIHGLPDSGGRRFASPSSKYRQQANRMIEKMATEKRLQKHPSYGYASPEQIEQLSNLGIGPERERILKQIEEQNKNGGKRK